MKPVNGVSNTLENLIFHHNTDTKWVKFGVLHEKLFIVYYTPPQQSCRGYTGFTMSIRPSVRPSVNKSYVVR